MSSKSIRNYFFEKLVFPKRAIIDKPGVLINQSSRRYGGVSSQHRTLYIFEDIIAGLQSDTVKEIGLEATRELWYKIGKDVGAQYLLLGGANKIPKTLMKSVLEYMFSRFRDNGCSVANDIIYNEKENSLLLKGEGNIICGKSKLGDFFSGVVAGVMSSLFNKNYEASLNCTNCPNGCSIMSREKSVKDYSVDINDLETAKEIIKLSLFEGVTIGNAYSFRDLLKFGKIKVNSEGFYLFDTKGVFAAPVQMLGLVANHYKKIGKEVFFTNCLSENSLRFSEDLFSGYFSKKDRLKFIKNLLSAFGWGVPFFREKEGKILVNFLHPPVSKYGITYQAAVLSGYLGYIYSKKFEIESIDFTATPFKVEVVYSAKP